MCSNMHINIWYKIYTKRSALDLTTTPTFVPWLYGNLAIGLLGLAVAGIAIKILVKPGELVGRSSNNPLLRNEEAHGVWGKAPRCPSGRKS